VEVRGMKEVWKIQKENGAQFVVTTLLYPPLRPRERKTP
jgi:hypothetical protein